MCVMTKSEAGGGTKCVKVGGGRKQRDDERRRVWGEKGTMMYDG